MSFLASVHNVLKLPEEDGVLPLWLALVASMAVFNTVQSFAANTLGRRLYSASPSSVTSLSSRTFGAWTFTSALIRLNTAYNIHDPQWYNLCVCTFLIALGHFSSEVLVFRTAKIGVPVLSPLLVSASSLFWMLSKRGEYLASV